MVVKIHFSLHGSCHLFNIFVFRFAFPPLFKRDLWSLRKQFIYFDKLFNDVESKVLVFHDYHARELRSIFKNSSNKPYQ